MFDLSNKEIPKSLKSKIREAEKLLTCLWDHKYYVSVSGGKDSLTMLHLSMMLNQNTVAYMFHNEFEDDEVISLAREICPDINIIYPKPSFSELIKKYGKPFFNYRWCCYHMREKFVYILPHQVIALGNRAEENVHREKRGRITRYRNKVFIMPLYSWTEKDVWTYSDIFKIKQWSGYQRGESRFGCLICPFRKKLK